jgi:hypothetical protein
MLAISVFVAALVTAPVATPRTCSLCGVYVGPNASRVTDPYLRQVDIWPEFYAASCRFEVARSSFVTLGRTACEAEAAYRIGR